MCVGHGLKALIMYGTNHIILQLDGALWSRNKMADMFADDISKYIWENFKKLYFNWCLANMFRDVLLNSPSALGQFDWPYRGL